MKQLRSWRYWLWFVVSIVLIAIGQTLLEKHGDGLWRYASSFLTVIALDIQYRRGQADKDTTS